MINKINVLPIINDHIGTLKDIRGEKFLKRDIFGFYVLPVLLSIFLVKINLDVPDKYVSIFVIAHTIFIPLLVNVVFLIYNIIDRGEVVSKNQKAIKVLKQLYSNIIYTVLASVLSLVSLTLYSAHSLNKFVVIANQFILYFVLIHIFLTLLMIFKRIHKLLSSELDHVAD